jgi:hypothetical protein
MARGGPVVGQDMGALLSLAPTCGHHHRDLGDAELPGGEHPGVARNQATVLAHQRRTPKVVSMPFTFVASWSMRAFISQS